MAGFTVRIELIDGDSLDYDVLNGAMEKRGFTRFYLGVGNHNFRLPTGEFIFEGEADVDQVLEWSKAAASETGTPAAIFITEAAGWLASGLQRD